MPERFAAFSNDSTLDQASEFPLSRSCQLFA